MKSQHHVATFGSGAAVGALGGLIGLGGAEFRLPLLIGVFGFEVLHAIILNKAMSLVVVASSLPFRAASIPVASVLQRWDVIVTVLAGSLAGAWMGADWATKLTSHTLYRILAVLLVAMAGLLLWGHEPNTSTAPLLAGPSLVVVGAIVGFGIGIVASLMGVAGGKLLIPSIVLLFGADIKLAVSLPTMIVGFTRYSRDQSFCILRTEWRFLLVMAVGSLLGAFLGGQLLSFVSTSLLLPLLAAILIWSAIKVWRHT